MVLSVARRAGALVRNSEHLGPVLLAMVVGALGGFSAIILRWLIHVVHVIFFGGGDFLVNWLQGEAGAAEAEHLGQMLKPESGEGVLEGMPSWGLAFWQWETLWMILLPAVGMVITSLLVRRFAMEAMGHGIPEVQYAVRKEGGRIRPRVAVVKAIASAICIGSGGSVGREGPIVQIGSSLGSLVGQVAKVSPEQVKFLVACGTAAAIGGTFNAPLAGVLFALEVVIATFTARSFGLVVVASVTGTAIVRAALGDEPAVDMHQAFVLRSPLLELPLYMMMGVVLAPISLLYLRSVYFFEYLGERLERRPVLLALGGGLIVGLLGVIGSRHLFGVGHEGVELVLSGAAGWAWYGLLGLGVLKILATSVTLGSGGSGGVFAPALFVGAMAGGAYGNVMQYIVPESIPLAPAGAYALVGMAALFAGAAHAPITSIVILFEMTDQYSIILPLMLAVVICHIGAQMLYPDSIYSLKLRRRGGLAEERAEHSVLDTILAADAMVTGVPTVLPSLPVADLATQFHEGHTRAFPVVDRQGSLRGIVTEYDVESALMSGAIDEKTVSDIMAVDLITCTPDQNLREVLEATATHDVGQIPVVAKERSDRLLGVLRRQEIFWAYGEMAVEHRRLLQKTGMDLPTDTENAVMIEVQVRADHGRLAHQRVRDVNVPAQCLIVMLRRGPRAVVVRGDTVLEPGDMLVILTTRQHQERLRHWVAELGSEATVRSTDRATQG